MSDKKNIQVIAHPKQDEIIVNMMIAETHKILDAHKPGDVNLYQLFVANFIGAMAYRALMSAPKHPCSKEDLFKFTADNFGKMKLALQDAVAAGVQGALRRYSGKDVEYYCQVKPVPEVTSKEQH